MSDVPQPFAEALSPPLAVIRARWDHMASVSGFDGLASALIAAVGAERAVSIVPQSMPPVQSNSVWGRILARLTAATPRQPMRQGLTPFVLRQHHEAAHQLATAMAADEAMVGLLLAGEEQLGHALVDSPPAVRRRLAVVLHQPPSWLRLHWCDFSALDGLRAVICLSTEQRDFIARACRSPVALIRHGVNLDHFTPLQGREPTGKRLLFVGQWMRDFATLRRAMEIIWTTDARVEIDCVIPRHARDSGDLLVLARDARTRWHADISADQLRDLYQAADLLFLPVIDATANNAVVEALACGLPIISTNVGGMPDYVGDDTGVLCPPGDAAAIASAALRWLADPRQRRDAGIAARRFATEKLDWSVVAAELAPHLGLGDRLA